MSHLRSFLALMNVYKYLWNKPPASFYKDPTLYSNMLTGWSETVSCNVCQISELLHKSTNSLCNLAPLPINSLLWSTNLSKSWASWLVWVCVNLFQTLQASRQGPNKALMKVFYRADQFLYYRSIQLGQYQVLNLLCAAFDVLDVLDLIISANFNT